jgi:hypothetical protein
MLLFKPDHVRPILEGRKVETRRIWKAWRCNIGSHHLAKTKMLSTEYFATLVIIDRWKECLGDITDGSAWREGYDSREDYLKKFAEINAKTIKKLGCPMDEIVVHVLEFGVIR